MEQEDYLCHHGVKGMKWGRRKDRRAANSAARAHYKADRTSDFNKYKKSTSKRDRKEGNLNESQIKSGRYRVARARSIKRNVASVAIGSLAGAGTLAAVAATGGAALPGILAAVGSTSATSAIAHFKTGAHYYGKQRKSYKKYKDAV